MLRTRWWKTSSEWLRETLLVSIDFLFLNSVFQSCGPLESLEMSCDSLTSSIEWTPTWTLIVFAFEEFIVIQQMVLFIQQMVYFYFFLPQGREAGEEEEAAKHEVQKVRVDWDGHGRRRGPRGAHRRARRAAHRRRRRHASRRGRGSGCHLVHCRHGRGWVHVWRCWRGADR